MGQTDQQASPRRSWWRRGLWWKVPVFLLLAIVVGVVGTVTYLQWSLSNQVEEELARLRQAGHPVNAPELDAWYAWPEGANAADTYQAAFTALVEDEALEQKLPPFDQQSDLEWPEPGEPLPPEMVEAMRAYLAKNEQALARLHQAAEIEGVRYSVNLEAGLLTDLPHLGELRQGAKLLQVQALLAAHDQKPERVVAAIEALVAAGRSLRHEPIMISHLVAVSIFSLTTQTLEQVLHRVAFSDVQLARLGEALGPTLDREPLVRAVIGERATAMDVFDHSTRYEEGRNLARIPGALESDRLKYLEVMERNMAMARASSPTAMPPAPKLDDLAPFQLITAILAPALEAAIHAHWRHRAQTQAAQVALAAKRYEMANGALPRTLDDLTPDYFEQVPTDPWDPQGRPLRLKRADTGIMVYSVGEDGVDNGGRTRDELESPFQEGTGIVFRIPPAGD